MTVPVLLTSFTGTMLLKHTKQQTTDFCDTTIEIGMFTRCLRYKQDWNRLVFLLQFHLWTPTRQPAGSHFAYDGRQLKLIVSISFLQVDNVCPKLSIADVAGVFNDAQLDDVNALSKSSTHHARSLPST